MKNYDSAIERIFRFLEMCLVIGLLNIAFRSALPTVWAFLFTIPFGFLAVYYLTWYVLNRHDEELRRLDPRGTLVAMLGFGLVLLTFWVSDRLTAISGISPV